MKIVPVISVHDALIGFKNINIVQNLDVGIRGFSNSIRYLHDSKTSDDFSASDMSLYHVGNFDLDTGEIESIIPKILIKGSQIIYPDFVDDPYEV